MYSLCIKIVIVQRFYDNFFFIAAYTNKSKLDHGGQNQIHCDFDHLPKKDQTCAVDIENWQSCSIGAGFSYNSSAPCIILKLNRVRKLFRDIY